MHFEEFLTQNIPLFLKPKLLFVHLQMKPSLCLIMISNVISGLIFIMYYENLKSKNNNFNYLNSYHFWFMMSRNAVRAVSKKDKYLVPESAFKFGNAFIFDII